MNAENHFHRAQRSRANWIVLALPFLWIAIGGAAHASGAVSVRFGLCDASAGVAISEEAFVVADDETNVLRVYRFNQGETPIHEVQLDRALDVDPKEPEVDIEGAARIGDLIYWISSHARNKNAKFRESRHRFFATRIIGGGPEPKLELEGRVVRNLQQAILGLPEARAHGFAAAAAKAPKEFGAFNIEGLAVGPEDSLWIGLRNPIPQGRALLLQLLNPRELVFNNAQPRFGRVVTLSMDGLGVRDLLAVGPDLIVIAGAHDGGGKSKFYSWDGRGGAPRRLEPVMPKDFNPEAILALPGKPGSFLVLSDDGAKMVDGETCKTLPPSRRSFRSVEIRLP